MISECEIARHIGWAMVTWAADTAAADLPGGMGGLPLDHAPK